MRLGKYLLCLFLSLLVCIPANATVSIVQHTFNSVTVLTASFSKAYASNTTAGNMLIAFIVENNGTFRSITGVSDTSGNTWKVLGTNSTSFASTEVAYVPSCIGGADTVSFTLSGTALGSLFILEISGADSSYPIESYLRNMTATATPITSPKIYAPSGDLVLNFASTQFQTSTLTPADANFSVLDTVSSSGTATLYSLTSTGAEYQTQVAASLTPQSFHDIAVSIRPAPTSSPHFVQGKSFYQGSTVTSQALPSMTINSGDMLFVTVQASFVPTVTGCSATWHFINQNSTPSQPVYAWYANNLASGACAPTVTVGSASTMYLTEQEYTNLPTSYSLDTWVNTGFGSSPLTISGDTSNANELLIAVASNFNNGTSTNAYASMSSGFVPRNWATNQAPTFTEVFDYNVASASTTTNTITIGSSSGNYSALMVAFRSTVPTIGRIQQTNKSVTSTISTTLAFNENITAGNLLVVTIMASAATDLSNTAIPTLSDNVGDVWKVVPYTFATADAGMGQFTFYCPNAVGGATTLTIGSLGSVSQNIDIVATEVKGMSNSYPYLTLRRVGPGGPTDASPLTIPSVTLPTGTYYLYNPLGDNTAHTYTSSGGALTYALSLNSPDFLRAVFDKVVTSGTYSNTITSSSTFAYASSIIIVFSATAVNQNIPHTVQATQGGSLGTGDTPIREFPLPVTSGNYLVVFSTWHSGSGSISDTMGNTWTQYSASPSTYGFWVTQASSTAMDTITVTTTDTATSLLFEINASGIQGHNATATTTGTTISTGNVTTVHSNVLLESFVTANPFTTFTGSAGWFTSQTSASHFPNGLAQEQVVSTTGTYSNSFTGAVSEPLSAGIVAFYGPSLTPSTTQPVINFLSMLNK
jgi:hypothetical protein